jgi:hypothetical protein
MSLAERIKELRDGALRPPAPTMPITISESELTPLGTFAGHEFYRHTRWGQLRERLDRVSGDVELPNLPVIEERDGDLFVFRVFDLLDPGTFERLTAPRPKAAPVPSRPVDGLHGVAGLDRRPEVMVNAGTGSRLGMLTGGTIGETIEVARQPREGFYKPPTPAIRGAKAILAYLEKKGASLVLAPDRASFYVTGPKGKLPPLVRDVVNATAPLLLAHLRGEPLSCALPHTGPAPEAVTLLLGGAPACAACMDGAA